MIKKYISLFFLCTMLLSESMFATINGRGETLCNLAKNHGYHNDLKYYMDEGTINYRNADGKTVLHCLIHGYRFRTTELYGDFKCFVEEAEKETMFKRTLLIDFNAQDDDGNTPLHLATSKGDIALVKYLLEKGANVNIVNNDQASCLHMAIKNPELVELLLQEGIDPSLVNKYGQTALELAASRGNAQSVQKLLARTDPTSQSAIEALHNAARRGDTTILESILKRGLCREGVDPNALSHGNQSPLFSAIINTNPSETKCACIEILMKYNANPHMQNVHGDTPLHFAARNGSTEALEMLITQYKANPNVQNNDGCSPLHTAINNLQNNAAIKLIDLGADLALKNREGFTPLHLTSVYNDREIVLEKLIRNGAPLNETDNRGYTPLHWAANKNQDAAEILMAAGADATIKGHDGKTATTLANMVKNKDLAHKITQQAQIQQAEKDKKEAERQQQEQERLQKEEQERDEISDWINAQQSELDQYQDKFPDYINLTFKNKLKIIRDSLHAKSINELKELQRAFQGDLTNAFISVYGEEQARRAHEQAKRQKERNAMNTWISAQEKRIDELMQQCSGSSAEILRQHKKELKELKEELKTKKPSDLAHKQATFTTQFSSFEKNVSSHIDTPASKNQSKIIAGSALALILFEAFLIKQKYDQLHDAKQQKHATKQPHAESPKKKNIKPTIMNAVKESLSEQLSYLMYPITYWMQSSEVNLKD